VGQKRNVDDMMDTKMVSIKQEFDDSHPSTHLEMAGHDSDSKSNASTRRTMSSDEAGSGHHSESEMTSRSPLSEEEEAATSLFSMMQAVASGLSRQPFQQQPHSAPAVMQSIAFGCDDDEHESSDDDGSGDPSKAKKLRRREKNRASAQQSRQRKKYHLEHLEQRVEELERDKAALSARLEALQDDNFSLKTRIPPTGDALGSEPTGECQGAFSEDDEDMDGVGLLAQLAETAQRLAT
jgi:hypothetical protein